MFHTMITNYQTRHFAKTWQKTLQQREIMKNNYRAGGDIKKAKAFASLVSHFTFQAPDESRSEFVIFSSDALAVPLRPAYIFAGK